MIVEGKNWIYSGKNSLEAQRNPQNSVFSTSSRKSMLWTQFLHDNRVWFSCFCEFIPLAFVNILKLIHCYSFLSIMAFYKVLVQLMLQGMKGGLWVRISCIIMCNPVSVQLLSICYRTLGNSVSLSKIDCLVH